MDEKTIRINREPEDDAISAGSPGPSDYPFETSADEFSTDVFDLNYRSRLEAYLAQIRRNPAPNNLKASWYELARAAAGGTPHLGIIASALDSINLRKDGSDMMVHMALRLLYQFSDQPAIPATLLERTRLSILTFKYWPDEPGVDNMCTWTENHYIHFSAAGFLAGQLFPKTEFSNSGQSGEALMKSHRRRIIKWMNLRFFTGFSEWLSNVYYDEDLTALINLIDFSKDKEIQERAMILVDLLLLDITLNQFKGVFGSTHGRSYADSKKWAAQESTTDTFKLLFGKGIFSCSDNMSAIAFALSDHYKLPHVLFDISNDQERSEMLNRQRMGILVKNSSWWGLNKRDLEDGLHFLTLGSYFHPKTINLFIRLVEKFNWWDHPRFPELSERKNLIRILHRIGLLPIIARLFEEDLTRSVREEVNLYTYSTPDYMISSAQDYRKGYGGDQHHVWQATMGPNAICFTTHPARIQGTPPNYWTGSGVLPRVAQIKNVLIAIYRIPKTIAILVPNELLLTHAWLPRDQFEEVIEEDGWIFTRLGDGYLALLSQHPYEWNELPGEDQKREVIVKKSKNIWICEMGRKEVNGDFREFVERLLAAEIRFSDSRVFFDSPTQGKLLFGWNGPLRRDGREIPLGEYPRYGNPYVQVDFPPEEISINYGENKLYLNWLTGERQSSSFT